MSKYYKNQDNTLVPKVIKEIAKELNLSEDMVKLAVNHFFKWQRESFNNLEYSKYLWNYFGTFSVIESRHEEYLIKQIEKQNKLTDKNQDNNE